jgi:hypothetical protein
VGSLPQKIQSTKCEFLALSPGWWLRAVSSKSIMRWHCLLFVAHLVGRLVLWGQ